MNTKLNKNLAKKLVENLYTPNIKEIVTAKFGTRNKVFFVHTLGRESDVVVRISENPATLTNFYKEQWCINKAIEAGIPAPKVLEVGNHIILYPYFVAKYKRGKPGNKAEDKAKLYTEMGKMMKEIHTIKTNGYGENFDWSNNQLSKINSWSEYLDQKYNVENAIKIYKENNILPDKYLNQMKTVYTEMKNFKFNPVLCHNDFLDKNVLINNDGKIISVLDWELAVSSHPFRDLGKTWRGILYYSGEKMVDHFFKGYGMKRSEYIKYRDYMYIFDFVKDTEPLIEHLNNKNQKEVQIIKDFWTNYFEKVPKVEDISTHIKNDEL